MNAQKQQAIEQIEKLKADIKALEEIVNAPEKVTYDDVFKKIKPHFWVSRIDGRVGGEDMCSFNYDYPSREIADREAIRTKWINIAEYVNEGWKPDWNDEEEEKYCFYYDYETKEACLTVYHYIYHDGIIYFKSEESAKLALEILGEDEFKNMCGVNQ